MDFTHPAHPLNPANPLSPLNPSNMDKVQKTSTQSSNIVDNLQFILIFFSVVGVIGSVVFITFGILRWLDRRKEKNFYKNHN